MFLNSFEVSFNFDAFCATSSRFSPRWRISEMFCLMMLETSVRLSFNLLRALLDLGSRYSAFFF